jgi:proline iminopeptidase
VKSGDITIFYALHGQGEPIYFLSGGPGITPAYMIPMVNELSKKFLCVLVHQRGTGKTRLSVNKENFNIDLYSNDIKSIKEKLLHKKIMLLGHSWGGMLAMHYLAKYPEDLSMVVLVSPGGLSMTFMGYFPDNINSRLSSEEKASMQRIQKLISQIRSVATKEVLNKEIHFLETELINVRIGGYVFEKSNAERLKLAPGDIDNTIISYVFGDLGRRKWDLQNDLAKVSVRTHIIQGRQDPIDLETAFRIQQAIKGSELHIIERCGHFPWVEQHDEFYKVLNDILARK